MQHDEKEIVWYSSEKEIVWYSPEYDDFFIAPWNDENTFICPETGPFRKVYLCRLMYVDIADYYLICYL